TVALALALSRGDTHRSTSFVSHSTLAGCVCLTLRPRRSQMGVGLGLFYRRQQIDRIAWGALSQAAQPGQQTNPLETHSTAQGGDPSGGATAGAFHTQLRLQPVQCLQGLDVSILMA